MTMRHAVPHNQCWYVSVTNKMVRENPERFKVEHIGGFLIRECVDLFEEGQIVSEHDIKRQLAVFRTGRLSAGRVA